MLFLCWAQPLHTGHVFTRVRVGKTLALWDNQPAGNGVFRRGSSQRHVTLPCWRLRVLVNMIGVRSPLCE